MFPDPNTEREVDAHNYRTLLNEAHDLLAAARHDLELAQGVLEDLDKTPVAQQLQPIIDRITLIATTLGKGEAHA